MLNNPLKYSDPSGHIQCAVDSSGLDYCIPGYKGNFAGANFFEIDKPDRPIRSIFLGQTHIGDYPRNLAEREEEIYDGNVIDLVDSVSDIIRDTDPSASNLWAYLHVNDNFDGSIEITELLIVNASEFNIRIILEFKSTATPMAEMYFSGCMDLLSQCYLPSPPRISSNKNDIAYLAEVSSKSIEIVPLIPSGNPINPRNRFGPSWLQTVSVMLLIHYLADPGKSVIRSEISIP